MARKLNRNQTLGYYGGINRTSPKGISQTGGRWNQQRTNKMSKIDNAIDQIRAMDSKTINSLVKELEGISKFINAIDAPSFNDPDKLQKWCEECMAGEAFPEIYQSIRGTSTMDNHKKLISEIILKSSIDRGDNGEPVLIRDSVTIPHFGTYKLSLDENGTLKAVCEMTIF